VLLAQWYGEQSVVDCVVPPLPSQISVLWVVVLEQVVLPVGVP
jgi:hypothetical protein